MTSRQRNSYSYFLAFEKDINNFQHPKSSERWQGIHRKHDLYSRRHETYRRGGMAAV